MIGSSLSQGATVMIKCERGFMLSNKDSNYRTCQADGKWSNNNAQCIRKFFSARIYVCLHIYMFVCMHICLFVRIYVCLHAYMFVYMYICFYVVCMIAQFILYII